MKFRWETEFKKTPIGEIPKDWNVKEIQEVMFINKRPKNRQDKPIAFIPMEKIPVDGILPEFEFRTPNEVKSGIEVPPSSILFAKITPSFEHGKMCIVPNNSNYRWIATTEVFSLIPRDNKVSTKFVFYYLRHPIPKDTLEYSMTGTSGRQRVDRHALETLLLPYPPPEEQQRIATALSWFDDLIENKRKQNEVLEKVAMAIFKSWFIDFEPFQDEEFVYSEELDMEIPKGWEVKPIGEVAEFHDSKRIPLSEIERQNRKGPYPYYGANGIIDYIDDYIFDGFYLLVAEDGTVMDERGLVVSRLVHGKFWANNHVHVITGRGVSIEYLYLHLKFTPIEPYVTGAVQAKLNQRNFSQMPVLIPPKPILEKFHSLVEPLFRKIIINEKEIMVLKGVRDTLLPQLVFGRLRVEEL